MATLVTVGHGTLTAAAFAALVRSCRLEKIIDIRRFPGSRRHPHFSARELGGWLAAAGVAYRWTESLGGRRKTTPDSRNLALRNPQFRGYADHMSSPEFEDAVAEVLTTASVERVALMCSEALWWRCHRRLLSDHAVLVAGARVEHLFHDGHLAEHAITPGARRAGQHLVYDAVVDQAQSRFAAT